MGSCTHREDNNVSRYIVSLLISGRLLMGIFVYQGAISLFLVLLQFRKGFVNQGSRREVTYNRELNYLRMDSQREVSGRTD